MATVTLRRDELKDKQVMTRADFPLAVPDSHDPFYSEENQKALALSRQQIKEGKVVVKTLEELEAMARE